MLQRCSKNILKVCGINLETLEQTTNNCPKWCSSIHKVCTTCEINRISAAGQQRQARKARASDPVPLPDVPVIPYRYCLVSNLSTHRQIEPPQPLDDWCGPCLPLMDEQHTTSSTDEVQFSSLTDLVIRGIWHRVEPLEAFLSSSGTGRDVHSLTLSFQHFLYQPWHHPTSMLPWRMGLERLVSWHVTCLNHGSFYLLTVARSGSCGPTRKLILLHAQLSVLCSMHWSRKCRGLSFGIWFQKCESFFSESASRVHVPQP